MEGKGRQSNMMFNKKGEPINESEMINLRNKLNYAIVDVTPIMRGKIVTVWTGVRLDIMSPPDAPPIIFETTFVDDAGNIKIVDRYRTLKEAQHGHSWAVTAHR